MPIHEWWSNGLSSNLHKWREEKRQNKKKIRFSLSSPFNHYSTYGVRFILKIPVFLSQYSIEHCSFFISNLYTADAVHFGVAKRVQFFFVREFHCTIQFNPNDLTQAQLGSCQYSFVCAMCAFVVFRCEEWVKERKLKKKTSNNNKCGEKNHHTVTHFFLKFHYFIYEFHLYMQIIPLILLAAI